MKFWKGSVDSREQLGDNWVPDFWVHTSVQDLSVRWALWTFQTQTFQYWTFQSQIFQYWTFHSQTLQSKGQSELLSPRPFSSELLSPEPLSPKPLSPEPLSTEPLRSTPKLPKQIWVTHFLHSTWLHLLIKETAFFLSIIHGFCNFAIECSNLEKNSRGSEMSQGSQWENLANLF